MFDACLRNGFSLFPSLSQDGHFYFMIPEWDLCVSTGFGENCGRTIEASDANVSDLLDRELVREARPRLEVCILYMGASLSCALVWVTMLDDLRHLPSPLKEDRKGNPDDG